MDIHQSHKKKHNTEQKLGSWASLFDTLTLSLWLVHMETGIYDDSMFGQ